MNTEISTIIFSKNRACQLELLLRNFNMPAVVIYTHDPEFKAGYEKLMGMYPSIKFIFQDNLKKQIIENLGEYTMFEVDDAVMLEPFSEDCPEFTEFKKNPDILCLSLRMCPHYTRGGTPVFTNNTWKWKGLKHSWGYPMAVTSNIFRKEDILPTILKMKILEIPHHLEKALRKNPPARPLMLCFDEPKLINNEANLVQSVFPTPNFGVDLKDLEQRFLKGERLSLEYMKESAKKAIDCFMRIDYEWSCSAKATQDKKKNNWLVEYRKTVTSQNGEDGVLEKIFEVLGIEKGWCVDVGARGIQLSNTHSLMLKGWSGVFIEADGGYFRRLKKIYRGFPAYCLNAFVVFSGEKSLDNLLRGTPIPKNFDFLSIDIDGNDYYIWESLKNYAPAVICIEFNPVKKLDDYVQKIDGMGGTSLSFMTKLANKKGYELISAFGANAFFVKKELFPKFNIEDNSVKEIFGENASGYGSGREKKMWSPDQSKKLMEMESNEENQNDITIIYYTANKISDYFFENSKNQLLKAAGNIPIISVSQKPIELGKNICVGDIGQSVFNIYKQALIGAKEAKTKYIAMAEDDILYSPEHFTKRSSPKTFAYNLGIQAIFTWSNPPIFSYIGRQVLSNLICERQLFIDAMEERHTKYPKDEDKPIKHWGEPGRCDKELGVTRRSVENIYTDIPNVVFSHQDSLCYQTLGKRKAHGRDRVEEIPYWGKARDVIHNFYKKPEGVDYVVEKFKVDLTQSSPIMLPINRSLGFPELLKELGIKKGVELGVYEGDYLETLKNKIPNLDLTGVDAWQPYEGYRDYGPSHIVNAYEKAKIRAEKNGTTLIRAFSAEASKQFENESLDFIYIDANHDFAHVIEDLNAWNPKIKKGGIISGSGFFKSKWTRHGVWHAIQAWCRYVNVPLFVIGGDDTPSWFYIKN